MVRGLNPVICRYTLISAYNVFYVTSSPHLTTYFVEEVLCTIGVVQSQFSQFRAMRFHVGCQARPVQFSVTAKLDSGVWRMRYVVDEDCVRDVVRFYGHGVISHSQDAVWSG